MSVISGRKSIATSILKSTSSLREDSMRKSKQLRFQIEIKSTVKTIINNVDEENRKEFMDLIYNVAQQDIEVT
jgi:hypothetical protein